MLICGLDTGRILSFPVSAFPWASGSGSSFLRLKVRLNATYQRHVLIAVLVGLSLEKMDELFGVTELLQRKNADAERGSNAGDMNKPVESHVEHVER